MSTLSIKNGQGIPMHTIYYSLIFALICFFVDNATIYLTHILPVQLTLLCCLYSMVYIHNYRLLFPLLFLISMQDMLLYNQWNVNITILLPLILINNGALYLFFPNIVQLLATGTAYWYIRAYCAPLVYQELGGQRLYTDISLSTILIGISLIYMTIWLGGMLGNRIKTGKKPLSL